MDWELFYGSFRKPDFISGYEIQNRLGGGAFGDVYKARKVSIDKSFAIKFLKIDETTSRAAIERELEQVRHFSAIDHPNLVTIEDMGVVLNVPYLVMGYAGEDTLARRLKRERLSSESALGFFVQTCRGVVALHERRLAHFDLKPSNVFLKGDIARVGDYGLAKLLIDGRQTLSFGRGTPQYMAPEMLKNRADQRADIYSLGVILYELYSGRLPYETSPDAGVVLREDDTPPVFDASVPPRVRAVVERCLRLDPADRFATVVDLLLALGQTTRAGDPLVALESLSADRAALAEIASAPGAAAARGAVGPSAAPQTPRTPALRNTATELTRGAVEVARGVWEGLKSPRPQTPTTPPPIPRATPPTPPGPPVPAVPPPPPSSPAPPRVHGAPPGAPRNGADDVVSIQTLDEAAAELGPVPRVPAAPIPAAASSAPAFPSPPPPPPPATAQAGQPPPSVTWSGTATAAIPVPPRSDRGVFGALKATFEVGLELMMSLLSGPVKRTIGGVGRAGGAFVQSGQGWFFAGFRLTLFLFGMLALGGLLMFLLFLFLRRFGV